MVQQNSLFILSNDSLSSYLGFLEQQAWGRVLNFEYIQVAAVFSFGILCRNNMLKDLQKEFMEQMCMEVSEEIIHGKYLPNKLVMF